MVRIQKYGGVRSRFNLNSFRGILGLSNTCRCEFLLMEVQVADPNQLVAMAFQEFPKVWRCKSEYVGMQGTV